MFATSTCLGDATGCLLPTGMYSVPDRIIQGLCRHGTVLAVSSAPIHQSDWCHRMSFQRQPCRLHVGRVSLPGKAPSLMNFCTYILMGSYALLRSHTSRRVHDTNSILAKHMHDHAHPHRHVIGTTPVAECGGDGSRSPRDRTGAASRHGTQRHQGAKFVNDPFRYCFRFGPQCATSHGMYVCV